MRIECCFEFNSCVIYSVVVVPFVVYCLTCSAFCCGELTLVSPSAE